MCVSEEENESSERVCACVCACVEENTTKTRTFCFENLASIPLAVQVACVTHVTSLEKQTNLCELEIWKAKRGIGGIGGIGHNRPTERKGSSTDKLWTRGGGKNQQTPWGHRGGVSKRECVWCVSMCMYGKKAVKMGGTVQACEMRERECLHVCASVC